MLATTAEDTDSIQESVRDVFTEVAVFFAAMTKAISQTRNPYGKAVKGVKPFYSIYNYDALCAVIRGSGYFVQVNEQDVSYKTSSWGATFSKELLEAILGLATGADELAFASAMVGSIGKEGLSISGQSTSMTSRVGNVIFVCEYLLGMPIVSAIVMSSDAKTASQSFTAGPCFREQTSSTTLVVHKETFMFVTPTFIKQYAGDLSSIMNDPAYLKLIMELESLVERTPEVKEIYDVSGTGGDPVEVKGGGTLIPGTKYAMYGQYLGTNVADKSNIVTDPATELTITTSAWNDEGIDFTFKSTNPKVVPSANINITLSDGITKISAGSFAFAK